MELELERLNRELTLSKEELQTKLTQSISAQQDLTKDLEGCRHQLEESGQCNYH